MKIDSVEKRLNLKHRDPNYNRMFMTYVTLFVTLILFTLFAPLNYFILDHPFLGVFLVILSIVCAVTIYLFRKTKRLEIAASVATAVVAVYLLAFALWGEAHSSTVTFTAILPGVAFFLLGHQRGTIILGIFFPIFAILFWWNTVTATTEASDTNIAINTILTVFVVSLQIFLYELTRRRMFDETARILEHLETLSSRDNLTGLWNRRMIEEFLEQEVARTKRQGNRFSIAIIDIDHFKQVNDTYGHAGGDTVLREIAAEFRNVIRAQDRIGRWGGEEFIVICPETGIEDARALFERLRAHIAGHVFSNRVQVTISVGISEYRGSDAITSLAIRADKAMYQAKQRGRNRVCSDEHCALNS